MADNRVDAVLTTADRDALIKQLGAVRQALPFLINLTAEERHALPKLGDQSLSFALAALDVAKQHPDMLPRSLDIEAMERDVLLFRELQQLRRVVAELHELIDDTTLAAGSEAYTAALVVYRYAKEQEGGEALNSSLDELARRFARKLPTGIAKPQ